LEGKPVWTGAGWAVEVLYSRAGVSTTILVTADSGGRLLLDCGDGTLRDLLKRELDVKKVAGVLVSHGHFDHVGGLHSLLGFMRMVGRKSDFIIVAPRGSLEDGLIIDAFEGAYRGTVPFRIDRREVTGIDELRINGFGIRPFGVVHHGSTEADGIGPPLPSSGYKLTYGSETVVYTGDCGLDSCLEKYIEGADLAIIEATLDEPGGEMEAKVHLSLENAQRLAEAAGTAFIIHRTGRKSP
jgi:ribonuclease BN (tRNA processing enzyme)